MYRISELADMVGLSRTTLLYYEKLGLICGERRSNGYRDYSELDVQRVRLIQRLKVGGLTLKECRACLESKIDRRLLEERIKSIDREIEEKQQSRKLLAGLLGKASLNDWHTALNELAPDAHLNWLVKQGFSEKEALHLRWLSKDMNEHEKYMDDFMRVFAALDRWGPGSREDSLNVISMLPFKPDRILEIGSGKGLSTLILAENTEGEITALDNDNLAISTLKDTMKRHGFSDRVTTVCASMTDLPFDDCAFDLIWAEGCAYIMGVMNALNEWKKFLTEDGILVISDLIWFCDQPEPELSAFWKNEYPDMKNSSTREQQIQNAGYNLLNQFTISPASWRNYIDPLRKRVADLQDEMKFSKALQNIREELNIYDSYLGDEFGYQFFILQKAR